MRYHFIVSGWNCSPWAVDCINSIIHQETRKDFDIFVIDDASDDDTYEQLIQNFGQHPKIYIFKNKENRGAAYSRYICINNGIIKAEDVCMLVGLDDTLAPNCLERVAIEYEKNGAQVTFGNWKNYDDWKHPLQDYLPETYEKRDFFKYQFNCTALNTFKAKLYWDIPKSDWIIDGQWIKNCTELPTMWGVMERAKFGSIKKIKDFIYLYNNKNTRNTYFRFGNADKTRISQEIIRRKKASWQN